MAYKDKEREKIKHKEYYLKNRENLKAKAKIYNSSLEVIARKKAWYESHKQILYAKSKEHRSQPEMKEHYRLYQREYRKDPEHKRKVSEYRKTYKGRFNSKDEWKTYKRSRDILRKYGIDFNEINNLLNKQDNKCAICRTEILIEISGRDRKGLAVDHNHLTGRVRGLLCKSCNSGLGFFKDNSKFLEEGIKYLTSE